MVRKKCKLIFIHDLRKQYEQFNHKVINIIYGIENIGKNVKIYKNALLIIYFTIKIIL